MKVQQWSQFGVHQALIHNPSKLAAVTGERHAQVAAVSDVSGSAIIHLLAWYDFILNTSCLNFSSITLKVQSASLFPVRQLLCWWRTVGFLNPVRVDTFKALLFSFPEETWGRLPAPPLLPVRSSPACSLQDGGKHWDNLSLDMLWETRASFVLLDGKKKKF